MQKPILHFSHANSYPAGSYRQIFNYLAPDFDLRYTRIEGGVFYRRRGRPYFNAGWKSI